MKTKEEINEMIAEITDTDEVLGDAIGKLINEPDYFQQINGELALIVYFMNYENSDVGGSLTYQIAEYLEATDVMENMQEVDNRATTEFFEAEKLKSDELN